MIDPIIWLASTIGKRGYIARYLREASPSGSLVIGTGNEEFTAGFMSCDRAFVLPGIRQPGYPAAVLELCRRERIGAAICLSDLDLTVLPSLRPEMESLGIHCFFPDEDTATRFLDKGCTAEFLHEAGIPGPKTYRSLDEAVDACGFPLVIKPSRGSASRGYGVFADRCEAERHWSSIEDPIAQEFLRGRLINVEAVSGTDGRILGLSVWERHASVAGETLLTETIRHDAAVETAMKILDNSPIPGPVDMDLIEVNGVMHVIEVNTRFGGGYPASHLAGADFTGALAGAIAGRRPESLIRYRPGVFMMKELDPVIYDRSSVIRLIPQN